MRRPNETSIEGWNPCRAFAVHKHPFCLCVCKMQPVSSLIKELKCWVCLSLPPSPFFSYAALEQSHRGIRVTLTDTKQDTALKQDRHGPDVLFLYYACCFVLDLAWLSRPASISWSVNLWSESGWCEETDEHRGLNTDIWQCPMWCFPLEAGFWNEPSSPNVLWPLLSNLLRMFS